MENAILIVKNAFKDKTLKNYLGIKVNITSVMKKHKTCIDSLDDARPIAKKGGDYNLFTFVTFPGASGGAYGATVCEESKEWKVNFIKSYDSYDCDNYSPPQSIDCTPSNRIVLTAEVNMKLIIG